MNSSDILKIMKKKKGKGKSIYRYKHITMRSQLEIDFAFLLDMQLIAGEIDSWEYEPKTLDLAPNLIKRSTYTPDFLVIKKKSEIERQTALALKSTKKFCVETVDRIFYEVKGWTKYREKGLEKLKSAANLYGYKYKFILVEPARGGEFKFKEYK